MLLYFIVVGSCVALLVLFNDSAIIPNLILRDNNFSIAMWS
jgi:hypothetical protein